MMKKNKLEESIEDLSSQIHQLIRERDKLSRIAADIKQTDQVNKYNKKFKLKQNTLESI